MNLNLHSCKLIRFLLCIAICVFIFTSCGKAIKDSDFVGKWQSSKLVTPIYLYDNGEWEIKTEEGAILQYGVWRYEHEKIIWSIKIDANIEHDANEVMSSQKNEFKLKERDGTTTVFNRL